MSDEPAAATAAEAEKGQQAEQGGGGWGGWGLSVFSEISRSVRASSRPLPLSAPHALHFFVVVERHRILT
jgi:hypothetical protein